MVLYHGTAYYNESGILSAGLKKYPHKGLVCACCSSSQREAGFFALRKTPLSDISKTGIVIEFQADLKGGEYKAIGSVGLLRDEREIAVLNTAKLKPIAVWRFNNCWKRESLK